MMVLIPNQMTKIDFDAIKGKKEVIFKVVHMDTVFRMPCIEITFFIHNI